MLLKWVIFLLLLNTWNMFGACFFKIKIILFVQKTAAELFIINF